MTLIKKNTVVLANNRSGEQWLCDDYKSVRSVDGIDFVEVYKENSQRKLWMNKSTLVKLKKINQKSLKSQKNSL